MNKKVLLPVGIVVVLVVAAAILVMRKGGKSDAEVASNKQSAQLEQEASGTPTVTPTASPTATPTPTPSASAGSGSTTGRFSGPEDGEPLPGGVDVQVFEVTYNGTSYSPASLTVKLGDVVIFKNTSKDEFWPASNPHPMHTDYPEFDPKKPISGGGEYEFKFTKAGTWKYHDHLNFTARGTVVVTP